MTTPNRKFEYLLNAMEHAAHAENPAQAGYAAKRAAVLDYVRDLETRLAACEQRAATSTPGAR